MEILIIIVAIVFAFFMLRELFLWYWKINKLVAGQEKTNLLLKQLINYNLYGKLEDPKQEELKKQVKTDKQQTNNSETAVK